MAARGGRLDVHRMLAGMTPGELDEWVAWSRLAPDPMLRLIAVAKLGLAAIATACGLAVDPDDLDPLRPKAKDKNPRAKARDDAEEVTPGEAAAVALATLPGAVRFPPDS